MRLEPEFWDALEECCRRQGIKPFELFIMAERMFPQSRSNAVRIFLIAYFRAASTVEGHKKAGHGGGTATGAFGGICEK